MTELGSVVASRIFDGLPDEDKRACLNESSVRDVKRGHALSRQGDPALAFYLVEAGLLKLVQDTPEGREVIVRFVRENEPFGGVVALDGASYPVTALAVEPTRVRVWTKERLRAVLEKYPQLRTNIMREMSAHMTDALTRVRELTTERVGQRLAHTLLRLMRQCGRVTPDGVLIAHPLTRQELAELSGTTLYTVSRTLSQWQADGILQSSQRQLLIRAPRRLDELAHVADEE
jgi:CRP-like cAMP-binding protein